MTRFIRERLRPIPLPRERCLDRSAEASDGEVKALRAVAGSLSWVARQCRPDEAGTASTLQGSVSRAVVKDLSDANRAVNRLKQTGGVGLLIHAIPLVNLRTVSISDAALGFTTSTLHQQGSASMSPISCKQNTLTRHIFSHLHALISMSRVTLAQDGCPHHVIHASCAAVVFDSLRLSILHVFTVSLIFLFILLIFIFIFHVGWFGEKFTVRFRE